VIRPIVMGPAWPLRVTGLICKGIPVITVCNPALWEYSKDKLGVLGHMHQNGIIIGPLTPLPYQNCQLRAKKGNKSIDMN
jgi:hypothetical protein